MPLSEIAHVVTKLDYIIHWSKKHRSRLGYFAALYQRVTIEVDRAIDAGYFDEGMRMMRFDILFAEYYLRAFESYMRGDPTSKSWEVAFEKAKDPRLSVMQHLFLGMNAHINLDLAVTVADVSTPENIHKVKDDFYRINNILASLVDLVQDQVAKVWGPLQIFDRLLGQIDEILIKKSLEVFRDRAWKLAVELTHMEEPQRNRKIKATDRKVARLAERIAHPIGQRFNPLAYAIRKREAGNIAHIIELLHQDYVYNKW